MAPRRLDWLRVARRSVDQGFRRARRAGDGRAAVFAEGLRVALDRRARRADERGGREGPGGCGRDLRQARGSRRRRRGEGRLIYVGAGTSGALAAVDAGECESTFSTRPGQVVALVAGEGLVSGAARDAA